MRMLFSKPITDRFWRQILFAGVWMWRRFASYGLALGAGSAWLVHWITGFGLEPFIQRELFVWLAVSINLLGLGPLLVILITLADSVTAMTAETASMKVLGEENLLALQGVDTDAYLVRARQAGLAVAMAALTVVFALGFVVAFLGAQAILDSGEWSVTTEAVFRSLDGWLLLGMLANAAVAGVLLPVIALEKARAVGLKDFTAPPRAVSDAIKACLLPGALSFAMVIGMTLLLRSGQ